MTDDQDQQAVIAFLSDAANLGCAGPVERIDTHGAMLFLAGDRAFKLKRAVKLPYLDFSTRALRQKVCEAELRLNRRTAPDMYLDVRSINRLADGSIGFGAGEPVDWVIEMRRFPAGDLLVAVAERGELSPALIRTLADRLAVFHAEAEPRAVGDGDERIRAIIVGNRASMAAWPDILDLPAAELLAERSLAALDKVAGLLRRRGLEGHVRHCHGDLHLANICLWRGEPTLFDCLEFDARLATIDVLYDLAFLLMDLWERGLRSQAALLFNRYLDITGESDGIAALPLFLSMRAAIRAHVSAAAANRQTNDDTIRAKRDDARQYHDAALALLDQAPPRLIVIGGLSGTGTSTLAAGLAPLIGSAPGARWLRTDVLRKRLAGVPPEQRLPADAYSQEQSARVYARLQAEARSSLAAGRAVILDGVFARREEREAVERIARETEVAFTGIWLEAPEALLMRRVSAREGDASDADAGVVARQMGYELDDLGDWKRIDASGNCETVRGRAQAVLG